MRFAKYIILLVFGLSFNCHAQPFGNEWINFQQAYYKIYVHEDGIYRVSYSELQNAGFPVDNINPKHLQLWFRGEEQAILVDGEADDRFDDGDFIEFYGQKNDGWLDRAMYEDPTDQTNPYKNIYSDQTAYFLTVTLDGTEGSRMEVFYEQDLTSTPAAYHLEEALIHYDNRFTNGQLYPTFFAFNRDGAHLSTFETGKGFTGTRYGLGNSNPTFTVPISNFVNSTDALQPSILMRLTGLSNSAHGAEVSVSPDGNNFRLIQNASFQNYDNFDLSNSLELSDFPTTDGNLTLRVTIQDVNPNIAGEMLSVSFINITYPQRIDAGGQGTKYFNFPESTNSPFRILISNPPAGARLFEIGNAKNMKLINGDDVNGDFNAVIPASSIAQKLLLTSEIKEIDSVKAITFTEYSPNAIDYLLIYHEVLSQSSSNYADPIQAYADYRASAAGGNYQVATAEINHLYDQFSYGEIHPLAIRRLVDYLLTNGGGQLKQLFLIGNGLGREFEYERNKPASLDWEFQNLVPCFGSPCSDNAFTAGLKTSNNYVHEVSTGRIAARTAQHVDDYLEKVIEHEQFNFDSFQRKDLLFLSGGQDENQRERMINYTQSFQNIAESTYLGGKTTRFSKSTTFAVELFDVAEIVNNGLGLICFFGHSAPGITDIDIGFASDPLKGYANQGKYPMILVNGCNAGAIFSNATSLGEDWTLTPNKGALLFTAHAETGFEFTMRNYSNIFLENLYGDSTLIEKSAGEGIITTHQDFYDFFPNDGVALANIQQFILQGDPALPLFGTDKAEYAITDEDLSIEPATPSAVITAATDSFKIAIALANYGAVNTDDVEILVRRTFNTGEERIYPSQTFESVFYKDTLHFVIRNSESDKAKAIGRNTFEVIIDPADSIPEVNENTNTASIDFFFANNAMKIVSPTEFSIVNAQPVRLLAQNINNLSVEREYIFQLDTTDEFNSPAFQETSITSNFTPSWSVNLLTDNNVDSIVYYWRARFANPTPDDSPDWVDASFLYIKDGPEGWSQSHFPQFRKNSKLNIIDNQTTRRWELQKDTVNIEARVLGRDFVNQNDSYIIKNAQFVVRDATAECIGGHLLFMAIDDVTGEVYNRTQLAFGFQDTFVCGSGTDFPVTRIPPNFLYFGGGIPLYLSTLFSDDYVMIMGVGDINYDNLHPENITGMASRLNIPANTFGDLIKSGEPFAAFTRLDDPTFTPIIIGPDRSSTIPTTEQTLDVEFEMIPSGQAQIISTLIGPAQAWTNAINTFNGQDTPDDSVKLDFYGVQADGVTETLLFEDLQRTPNLDISSIAAADFPFGRFKATIIDDALNTATQLDKWQAYFTPLPEGILYPETVGSKGITEYEEGEDVSFNFAFRNVSAQTFSEPLIVQYSIKKQDNSIIELYDTLQVLQPDDSISITKTINTIGFAGTNTMTIFANPFLQAEQDYSNNFVQCQFKVLADTIHPVLEVVVDGRHIMAGDLVSSTPLITISGKDENQFLSLNDTSNLDLFLSEPNSEVMNRISLNDPNLTWTSQGIGSFQVEYQSAELADGVYRLRVQLKDASSNLSGLEPFETSFEVVNKSTITHFYPYPNPFSTSVRFVFTLTGNNIPDEIKIQIMTVSGRVVREITQDELGSLHIGNNISEYAWDGKDEYGDQLANGVYLYRVITRYNGENIEHRETAKDNLFKKGIGKMYLLR